MSKDNKFNPKVADKARELIGMFIKQRRTELKITQQQLADMANVRKATIIDVEAGRSYNFNTLLAIIGMLRGEFQIIWKDPESIPHFEKPSKN